MGSIPPELSLDIKPTDFPKTINCFLKQVSMISDVTERARKIEDYLVRLEDEMRKIDAFKRELPLCMLLLIDAIELLKEESTQCTTSYVEPILEEFIPLKENEDHDHDHQDLNTEIDSKDKKNWMSSIQLWNPIDYQKHNLIPEINKEAEKEESTATDDASQSCKKRIGGRAFLPFKGYCTFPAMSRKEDKGVLQDNGLSLVTPGTKNSMDFSPKSVNRRIVSNSTPNVQSNSRSTPLPPQQTNRKQRRCWSPELHRRFVNALQQLGGSQAATPKQIRELMQVDGLTNDEVKSHLQKYRLHTRRIPNAATSAANQSLLLGGLWMHNQDQYNAESSKPSSSQSGSPQGPLHLGCATGGTTTTTGGDTSDDDDGRSESHSWKGQIHKPTKENV